LFEGEIDLLILRMVYHFSKDFEFRGFSICNFKEETELTEFPREVFLKISSTRNSDVAAKWILAILSTRENKELSHVAIAFLKSIMPLSETLGDYAITAIPPGRAKALYQHTCNPGAATLVRGSTISSWLYLDPSLTKKLPILRDDYW
jgi:hypothetical protein